MAHNFGNFKYSHTIQPPPTEIVDEEEDLEALFKIGNNYIEKSESDSGEVKEVRQISVSSREKKIRKKDRQRKEKKERKERKKEKKEKKQKKRSRKQRKDKQQDRQSHSDVEIIQKSIPTEKIIKVPSNKHNDVSEYFTKKAQDQLLQKLNSTFAYNQKLGRDCVSFCIINFPQKGLFEYGLAMNDIPQYRRINHNTIVGMKSGGRTQKLLVELNKQLGQRQRKEEDLNQGRYYSYKGLDQIEGQTIKYIRTRPDADQKIIAFDSAYWADTNGPEINSLKTMMIDYRSLQVSDAQLLRLNRQYNIQLSKNPKDISIWLKFIGLQQHISRLATGSRNKQSLLERKLSIVQKALQSNPNETKLMVVQLNIMILLQREDCYNSVSAKTMEYLNLHPYSIQLWETYLDFRFSNLVTFTNGFVRKEFEDITIMLRKKTSQATSASLIWKIRKASLYVLQKIMTVLKLEGYNELSTGIGQALLEYNIFIPAKINSSNDYNFRSQAFKAYWEDYNAYRLGELDSINCWDGYYQNICIYDDQTYIGKMQSKDFFKNNKDESQQWVDRQISAQRDIANWRPSHVGFDEQRIEKSPQSFVLMDDIEHLLQIYRDNENIQLLVDIVFENLGFPPIFNQRQTMTSEYLNNYIYHKLLTTLKEQKMSLIESSKRMDLWINYWHPLQTYIFMDDPNWQVKLLYIKRLLCLLRVKLSNKLPVTIYQMFIQIVIYLNEPLINSIYDGELQKCKDSISNILQQDPANIQLWISYIEGQHLKTKNTQECIGVYRQLLTFQNLSRKKVYTILYHFYASLKRWKENVEPALVLILGYLREHKIDDMVDKPLRPFDVLVLFNLLLFRYRQFQESKSKNSGIIGKQTKRHILSYFILDISSVFEPSEQLKTAGQSIAARLQSEATTDSVSCRILLQVEYKTKLPTISQNIQGDLCYLEYLMITFDGQTFLLKSFLSKQLGELTLAQWMVCMCCYRHSYNEKLIELFFLYGQELAKGKGVHHQITFTVNFCKLLSRWQPNPTFLFFAINHIPYAKQLFLLFLKGCSQQDHDRIRQVLVEKQLRLVDKSLNQNQL